MFNLQDVENIEANDCSEKDYYRSLQRAINAGMWSLQGSYGRAMMQAIEDGRCCLGRQPARDYWGNLIPSRKMVQQGTKGSTGFVRDQMGDEWGTMIERVK